MQTNPKASANLQPNAKSMSIDSLRRTTKRLPARNDLDYVSVHSFNKGFSSDKNGGAFAMSSGKLRTKTMLNKTVSKSGW